MFFRAIKFTKSYAQTKPEKLSFQSELILSYPGMYFLIHLLLKLVKDFMHTL